MKKLLFALLVIAHPASSGTAYTALITVLLLRGEEQGREYWGQFNANVWQYSKSGAAPAQHVSQGEAAVGVVFSHDIVTQMEKGLPIVLSFAKEGMGWEIGGMAIVKGAQPSRPELLQVTPIDYNFEYAGKNKKAFIDKFTNDIAAARR